MEIQKWSSQKSKLGCSNVRIDPSIIIVVYSCLYGYPFYHLQRVWCSFVMMLPVMKFTFTFSASHRLGRRCNRLFVAAATVQPFSASSGDLNLNQIHQRMAGRKRFYKQVGISPITVEEAAEGSSSSSSCSSYSDGGIKYLITLDGRTLKTPARNPFHIPNMELALAVAAEWDAQLDNLKGIEPTTMPMTQMMFTAIDQISVEDRKSVV